MANKLKRPSESDSDETVKLTASYLLGEDDGTGVEKEDVDSDVPITQPFDPTLIRVETKPMTIDLLLTRIREEELDLAPGFQRRAGIWKSEAKSRLIESLLIRIPLPAFYLDATVDDRWVVVDGLQRLTALKEFVIDESLKLTGLEFLTPIEGKRYRDLPRNLQRRINETQVTAYLIEKGTPAKVKFNIFKRINTGGLPLSAQEIRHALNQGAAVGLLERLANSAEFKRATDNSIRDERMADRECVLRFLAFSLTHYQEYKVNDFDSFLNEKMAQLNSMPSSALADLSKVFTRTMKAAHRIFERNAFRKLDRIRTSRFPINKALFEAWAVSLSRLPDAQIDVLAAKRKQLNDLFLDLFDERDFDAAVSQGTGDPGKVRLRFTVIEKLILEVLA